MAHDAGKAGVLVVNKWDVGRQQTMERMPGKNPLVVYTQMLRDEMPFVAYAPVAFCSALRRTGIGAAVETALSAAENHSMRIPTGELNRIVRDAVDSHPLNDKGRTFKVRYATMASVKPPTIVLFVNDPEMLHFGYRRYLENQIRKAYAFEGTPIRLFARKADEKKDAA
jgi:GTP-binding protein